MTKQQLADYSCVSLKLVDEGINKIKGIHFENDEPIIPEGSRYPFDAHRYKFDNRNKRIDALLKATSKYQYVDEDILNTTKESFETMIAELQNAKLIQHNGSVNPYGANCFDTTMIYEQFKDERMTKRIQRITDICASAAGNFTGGIMNSYNS